jgi:hypothetical protein
MAYQQMVTASWNGLIQQQQQAAALQQFMQHQQQVSLLALQLFPQPLAFVFQTMAPNGVQQRQQGITIRLNLARIFQTIGAVPAGMVVAIIAL